MANPTFHYCLHLQCIYFVQFFSQAILMAVSSASTCSDRFLIQHFLMAALALLAQCICIFIWVKGILWQFAIPLKTQQIWHWWTNSIIELIYTLRTFKYSQIIIMLAQNSNKQIISLWIGKESQQCAFSFYNLQAEQIFDDENDPILHSSIWKSVKKLQPRMIIFDTQIQRLAAVREVNNKKMIQKMKKQDNWNSLYGVFGQIDAKPLESHESVDVDKWPQLSNWTDRQNNYVLINKSYTSLPKGPTQSYSIDLESQRFHTFEQFYKINHEQSQDRIRQELQKTDFLKVLSVCTDQNYSGFTNKIVEYLRYQCPKKSYILTSLSQNSSLPIFSISHLYDEVDIFVPIDTSKFKVPYFKTSTFYSTLAPYFSSLLTPFALKQADPDHYISTIMTDNRKLFNTAFCLPVIDHELNLNPATNIFKFEEAFFKKMNKNNKENFQEKGVQEKIKKQTQGDEVQPQVQQKLNFTNESYLSLFGSHKKGRFVSESYILKGHFNDFDKLFKPKSQPSSLSIKYLQAIFAAPQEPTILYDKYYAPWYNQVAQSFPYQLAMFSHEIFGDSIRSQLSGNIKKNKLFNEELPESKEKILSIADSYLQLNDESD